MNKISLVVIKENNCDFLDEDLTVQKVFQSITPYISIHEVYFHEMMEFIIKNVGLTPDGVGVTDHCAESATHVYQICYLSTEKNKDLETPERFNSIATILSQSDEKVYGPAIFLSSKITESKYGIPSSATAEDISRLLYQKKVHICLLVKSDGTVEEKSFREDPIKQFYNDKVDDYKWIEIPFLRFNLIVFFQKNPIGGVNKKITKLNGRFIIDGDCILVSKSTEYDFIDITNDQFDKMLKIAEGPLSNRVLRDDEKEEENDENQDRSGKLPKLVNRFTVLEDRYKNYKTECGSCKKIIINEPKVCSGCFRINYCDKTCQGNEWIYHKDDCLHGKKSINYLND